VAIDKIHPAIYRITVPFDTTGVMFAYLVKGDRLALVDTGVSDSPGTVLRTALREIGIELSDVSAVLSTHAHLDHIGGNMELKRASSAKIYLHLADLPLARSVEAEVEFHTSPLRQLGFSPEALEKRAAHVRENAGEAAGADVVLADGDLIDLGAGTCLRVIHCPGHTPGQVAYWWEKEGILLTGDGVQGQGSRPGGYPLYHDAPAYRRSLDRLLRLEGRLLCLGHAYLGGTLINNPVRVGSEVGAFIRAAASTADTIHRAALAAIEKRPQGSRREMALAALDELLYEIPQLRLRGTGMPVLAGPTLLTHIESALANSYPV
jgi:glyoxylase-like metal-dependent hydrolase (beta-lactamase superfamily II)